MIYNHYQLIFNVFFIFGLLDRPLSEVSVSFDHYSVIIIQYNILCVYTVTVKKKPNILLCLVAAET